MNALNLKLIMEVVDKITSPIRGITARFQSMMKSMSASVGQLAERMDKIGKKTAEIGGFLTSRLTLPIVGAGALSVRAAGQVEDLVAQFEHLAGGTDKAAVFVKSLQGYIDKFGLGEVEAAANKLRMAGYGLDEIRSRMGFLGDVAAGSRSSIAALTEQYLALRKAGKVSDGDLDALKNANIPIVQELAKQLGRTDQQIINMAAHGKITFEQYRSAMVGLTQQGGEFYNAMEKQGKRINGFVKEISNSLKMEFAALGSELWEKLNIADKLTSIKEAIRGLITGFLALPDGVKSTITWFVLIAAAIGPVVMVVGQITVGIAGLLFVLAKLPLAFAGIISAVTSAIKLFKTLTLLMTANPFGLIILGITALVAAGYMLVKHWDSVKAFFGKLWEGMKAIFTAGLNIVLTLLQPFTFLPSLLIENWGGITGFFSGLWDGISGAFKAGVNVVLGIIQPVIDVVKWLIDGLGKIGRIVGSRINQGWEHLKEGEQSAASADPVHNTMPGRGGASRTQVAVAPAMSRPGATKVDAGGTIRIQIDQNNRARVVETKSNDSRVQFQPANTGQLMGGF